MQDIDIIGTQEKGLEELTDASVQSRAKGDMPSGLFWMMYQSNSLIPAWWSPARDVELRRLALKTDHFIGAVYSMASKLAAVPFRIEPRNPAILAHREQAEMYQSMLEEQTDFYAGWINLITTTLYDRWTSDAGFYWEIIGDGKPNQAIKGPALGIAVLDAQRCTRTGDPEYPVTYLDRKGLYKFHYTRVAYSAELPSPRADMNGIGHSWISRCLGICQNMVDIVTYKQEKLGSRTPRAIIYGSGVTGEALAKAVEMAAEASSNAGLSRFGKIPVLGAQSAAAAMTLNTLDLSSLPDGFDYQTDTTLGMYAIALAGGFPPRWLWPATAVGATKADAMLQHTAMSLSGASSTLAIIRNIIGGSERGRAHVSGKFLPPYLKFIFDFQDDEQDLQQAQIRDLRSKRHQVDVVSGMLNLRVAREQMLADGDLTEAQFEDLELADDRTAEGEPVSVLFYRDYPRLAGLELENPNLELLRTRLAEAYKDLPDTTDEAKRREIRESIGALRSLARHNGLEDEPPFREVPEIPETPEVPESLEEGAKPKPATQGGEQGDGESTKPEGSRDGRQGVAGEEIKQADKVQPRGRPLPEWTRDTVPFTPEDVIAAIQQWDKDVPDAAGLLMAVPETAQKEQDDAVRAG